MDREVYREAFHLNDTELDLIAGLIPPGQMLIRKARSSKKVRLNVDSVSHWMASNNARDNLKKRDYFERYGIAERGQQYAGWAELPSGIPLGPRTMTVDEAARILATAARDCDGGDLVVGATGQVTLPAVERAYKQAVKLVHPDAGGDHDAVVRLTEATELLRQAAQ